jgi:cysteine synthase A
MTGMGDQIGGTPLVALHSIGRDLPTPVWVKCEHRNPCGSAKDRLAKAIEAEAKARGDLQPGMPLIEATAGSTGLGPALLAAAWGQKLVVVMPEKMLAIKLASLRG